MPRLTFPHNSLDVAGAVECVPDPAGGIRPLRLPVWARAQSTDVALDLMSQMACGVRVRFATSSERFLLVLHALRLEIQDAADPWPAPVVAVTVDGEPFTDLAVPGADVVVIDADIQLVEIREGGDDELRVDDLPVGLKQIEVWLPQSATCVLKAVEADDLQAPAPDPRPTWWHYGSSISHGFEATGPLATWPSVAARGAGANLTNLGFAGQAMLDPFVARTIAASDADVVSLCLGINIHNAASMTLRTFEPAVHGFLDLIRDRRTDVPIVVISPIPFPAGEQVPGPDAAQDGQIAATGDPDNAAFGSLTLATIRDMLARIVGQRSESDPHLQYLDGRDLLHPDEAHHLGDGLHPDAAGLGLIGQRFTDTLRPLLSS